MSWKKAVFYGGAVLVLSACDNATAPTSPSALNKLDAVTASATKRETNPPPAATPTAPPSIVPLSAPTSCAAAVIHVGLDGQLIVVCPPTMW